MELKTAIEILEYHQEWRLGKREDMIHEPKKLTEALDVALLELKKKKPIFYCKNRVFVENYHGTHCTFQCAECRKGAPKI
jgi:hypothetical protein